MEPDLHNYHQNETFYEVFGMPELNSGIFDNSNLQTSRKKHFTSNTPQGGIETAQNQHFDASGQVLPAQSGVYYVAEGNGGYFVTAISDEHRRILAEMANEEERERLFREGSEVGYGLDSGKESDEFDYMNETGEWAMYTPDGELRQKPINRTTGNPTGDKMVTSVSKLADEVADELKAEEKWRWSETEEE